MIGLRSSPRFSFFKEVVDKENITFLKTKEGWLFVKANQCIHGSYSENDAQTNQQDFHKSGRCHKITSIIYTDPSFSMYAVLKKKPLFLEHLLNLQLEQEIKSNNPDILKHILFQGSLKWKTDILNLSIETHSNKCFDVILNFIISTNFDNMKFNIDYGNPTALYTAILKDNDYALHKLLEIEQAPNRYESKGKYQSPFILSFKRKNPIAIKFYKDFYKENLMKAPEKINSFLKMEYKGITMREYIETNSDFNEIMKFNESSEIIEKYEVPTPLQTLTDEINQDNAGKSTEKAFIQCEEENCTKRATNKCDNCNKYFCGEHIHLHACF